MGRKRNYHRLTEVDYWAVKHLIDKGYSTQKVTEMTGRGSSTISTVRNSSTFEEYRRKVAKKNGNIYIPGQGYSVGPKRITAPVSDFKPQISRITPKPIITPILPKNKAEIVSKCVIDCVGLVCATIIVETLLIFGGIFLAR